LRRLRAGARQVRAEDQRRKDSLNEFDHSLIEDGSSASESNQTGGLDRHRSVQDVAARTKRVASVTVDEKQIAPRPIFPSDRTLEPACASRHLNWIRLLTNNLVVGVYVNRPANSRAEKLPYGRSTHANERLGSTANCGTTEMRPEYDASCRVPL